jgi:hypothetical protein
MAANKIGWRMLSYAFVVPAGLAARRALGLTWRLVLNTNPPRNPASRETSWPEALAWAAASGMAMGAARLVAARGATATWRSLTGSLPPGAKEDSAESAEAKAVG